jgi:hypothetical protein
VNIVDLFRNQIVPVYITDEIKTHGFVYYLHATDVTCQSGARQCVLLRSGAGGGTRAGGGPRGGAGTRAGGGTRGGAGAGIALLGTNHIYKVTERANVYAIIKLNCD